MSWKALLTSSLGIEGASISCWSLLLMKVAKEEKGEIKISRHHAARRQASWPADTISLFALTSVCGQHSLTKVEGLHNVNVMGPASFFSLLLFLFSCMAHCQLRFCAFFIRWFTEVMCHNQWHSRHCIRRRGVHVSDLDSAAGCGAPSRRMHKLLPEISAVCAVQRFDTLQTQLSACDLCDNASLFLMPKPGKGHIKYCAISERLSTGTKRSAHNNLR